MHKGWPGAWALDAGEGQLSPQPRAPWWEALSLHLRAPASPALPPTPQRTPGRRQPHVMGSSPWDGTLELEILNRALTLSLPLSAWASVSPLAKASGSRKYGRVGNSLHFKG